MTCKGSKRERYRRLTAVFGINETDLNGYLVRQGVAFACRKYAMIMSLPSDRRKRIALGCGPSIPQGGEFQPLWSWRSGVHLAPGND